MTPHPQLYLASASPRRRELLLQLGFSLATLPLDIDETRLAHEAPRDYVQRLAQTKAAVGWQRLMSEQRPLRPLLAADTTVVIGNDILGKPQDAVDARGMLQRLSERRHQVFTAVAVQFEQRLETVTSVSEVRFAKLSMADIDGYIATGEPFDKAGAYGIQGIAGAFVAGLNGSFTGVMGLPVYETAQLLARFGVSLWSQEGCT